MMIHQNDFSPKAQFLKQRFAEQSSPNVLYNPGSDSPL
jgi:hypothetical protein